MTLNSPVHAPNKVFYHLSLAFEVLHAHSPSAFAPIKPNRDFRRLNLIDCIDLVTTKKIPSEERTRQGFNSSCNNCYVLCLIPLSSATKV